MAITFDPATKIIQLDSHTVSERELWTAMVDWAVLSDNLKYGIGMTQLGGVAPIALYIYLELGWKIRPMEENGITTVTGNVLVQGGGSPIASTIGNFNILVNMETPVKSSAIEVTSGSGLSTEEHNRLMSPNIEGISSVNFHSNLDSYENKNDWKGSGGFTDDDRIDLAEVKSKTDSLNFTGNDIQSVASNMRGTDIENLNNLSSAEVKAEVSSALIDEDIAKEANATANKDENKAHTTAMNMI